MHQRQIHGASLPFLVSGSLTSFVFATMSHLPLKAPLSCPAKDAQGPLFTDQENLTIMTHDTDKPYALLGVTVIEWMVAITLGLLLCAFVVQGVRCTLGDSCSYCLS